MAGKKMYPEKPKAVKKAVGQPPTPSVSEQDLRARAARRAARNALARYALTGRAGVWGIVKRGEVWDVTADTKQTRKEREWLRSHGSPRTAIIILDLAALIKDGLCYTLTNADVEQVVNAHGVLAALK